MKIAIVGLGKMGHQIASKLVAGEHTVIGFDQNPDTTVDGAQIVHSKGEVIAAFNEGEQPVVWLMIPAAFVETELGEWFSLLPANSLVIDGGNSDYRLTAARAELAGASNIHYVDVGTSGGVHGADNGFSMMVGGIYESVASIAPVLGILAKPHGGWRHVGPAGAGHYVKMVHNAIEYGMMQSLAEGYQLLAEGPYKNLDLATIGDLWEEGSIIASNLNALTAGALKANPTLEDIDGIVAESGEARWAIETAHASGLTMPAIEESLKIRLASQQGNINFSTKLLAAMRNAFGGHNIQGK